MRVGDLVSKETVNCVGGKAKHKHNINHKVNKVNLPPYKDSNTEVASVSPSPE